MMTFVLQNGWSPLYRASLNGHLDIVRALIEAGASISQANKVGSVLVNQSLFTGKWEICSSKIVAKNKHGLNYFAQ